MKMMVRMPRASLRRTAAVGLLVVLALTPAFAAEQTAKLPPNSYQGLGMSSDQPIQFESEQLEVHDQDKTAVFIGHVIVRQGTTVLKTDRLTVFYQGSPTGEGPQQVSRLEAKGSVLVTSSNQTASGEAATFDTAANTILLTGNVVLTQGDNVIRGSKLLIDINTSQAKMLGGRVQMLIAPKSLDTKG
jgi:lipopolysaccharide transport periplasmic protein LptA